MAEMIPATAPDYDRTRLIERPDGFYWQSRVDDSVYGPFATLVEAVNDMDSAATDDAGEPLDEAESEIGIADWIDPDTGLPAEDSIPHLDDR